MSTADDEIRVEVIIKGPFVRSILRLLEQSMDQELEPKSAKGEPRAAGDRMRRPGKPNAPAVYLGTEAAAILGASIHTLADWSWKRIGPPWIRISRSWVRYDQQALYDWLASRAVEEIPKPR